jgi:RNA polymerase sigma factor (sigma-70 family)
MAEPRPPDEENTRLAIALLENDESALEDILRLYGPDVSKLLNAKYTLRLRVLTHEDIEDVVIVALHRLWEARASYDDGQATLRAWFYCIADNFAKDVNKLGLNKARMLEWRPGKEWLEQSPKCATRETTEAEGEQESQEKRDLRTVVNNLPDVQRRIILADSLDRDEVAASADVAADLGIPVAYVKVYRQRGMATIRKEMRKLGHNIP